MTPRLKAEELYWKYYNQIEHYLDKGVDHRMAVVCALIAVEEIISICTSTYFQDFWINVKKELLNL